MISGPDMGLILAPLEKRFKALTKGQVEIYHSRLCKLDPDVLREAVEHFVDQADGFPKPGVIKSMCWKIQAERDKGGNHFTVRSSCTKCRNGLVKFWVQTQRRDGSFIAQVNSRPCAVCNTEMQPVPHYIQIQDRIYKAAKKAQGSMCFIPDLNGKEITDHKPVFESETLEQYYAQEQGKVRAMPEPRKPDTLTDGAKRMVQGAYLGNRQ